MKCSTLFDCCVIYVFNYLQDCGPLKAIMHGLKLKKFVEVEVPDIVACWIQDSRLMHLSLAYLMVVDVGLILIFIERWHKDTNSFHMSIKEMTITLDDVTTLLHIPPCGRFFSTPTNMNINNVVIVAHELLRATIERKKTVEINFNKCVQYRLQWLCNLYKSLIGLLV